MLKITLISAGKIKDRSLAHLEDDYLKRLRSFAQVRVEDVSAARSESDRNQESLRLLERAKSADFLVALDERGKQYSSVEFSDFFQARLEASNRDICFLIGGAFGLSQECKQRCDALISLSRMTFPHKLCRVIFLEQLYRASSILGGHPYHKD